MNKLRSALAKVDADIANDDFASGTEFSGSEAMALVDDDFREFPVASVKTLVPRARSFMQHILDSLTQSKADAEKRIAQAEEVLNSRMAEANNLFQATAEQSKAERNAAVADAEQDLANLSATKEAIDLAVGRLNRA